MTSLYLDSPHLTFLRWHRLGATDRFKLRIRRYGDQPTPTLYAEVKRKTGSVVHKRRAAFPVDSLHLVLGSSYVPSSEAMPGDSDDLKEFVRHRSRCRATPRVLVTCVRESLRDAMDGTALTVDRDLRYQPNRRADLAGTPCAWRPIPLPGHSGTEMALVELKYLHHAAAMDGRADRAIGPLARLLLEVHRGHERVGACGNLLTSCSPFRRGAFDLMSHVMSDIYPPYIQGLAEAGRLLVAACIGVLVVAVQRWTRRSGPLSRSMEQAHVLLCLAGALMMLIVGDSIARAFGIAGAAAHHPLPYAC